MRKINTFRWALLMGAFALLGLAYFGGPPIHATTSTITGNIQDSQGNPVNGTITFQLPVPAQDTATNTAIAPSLESYRVVNGAIQSGPPLYDVAGLQPANLFYIAKVYDRAGNLILSGNYVVTGASFNFGAATPTSVTTSNISYVTPVTTSAPNTFTAAQSFPNVFSSNVNIASAGWMRLSNTDAIGWRNAANSGNLFAAPGFLNSVDTIQVNGINLSPNKVEGNLNQSVVYSAGTASTGPGIMAIFQGTSAQGVVNGSGGSALVNGGNSLGTGNGGDIVLTPGVFTGSGSNGNVIIAAHTFANLGTPSSNGALAFCSDCTIANPCAGGGTGALAKRLNGIWVCN